MINIHIEINNQAHDQVRVHCQVHQQVSRQDLKSGKHISILGRRFSPSHERIEIKLSEIPGPFKLRWLKFRQKLHKVIPFICRPKTHHCSGANIYRECPVCLRREVESVVPRYSPIDVEWLKATGNCSSLNGK